MMKKKYDGRGFGPNGPPPEPKPPAMPGDTLSVQYGHNVSIRKVIMIFNLATSQVVFTPEEAEHVASQLLLQAEAARGGRTTKVS